MAQPTSPQGGLYEALLQRGMSRRTFLKFCSASAAVLALPTAFASRIAAALETAPRLPLVWLHGQACGGETAAFLASASPTAAELLLSLLSVDYQEMLMAASGESARGSLTAAIGGSKYLAVIEGSIPAEADGMYCIDGGRPFLDLAREVTGGALATIAVGACAVDGGVASARGGVSGPVGASQLGLGSRLVNLPGCPVNVDNLAATVVHYLTFDKLPPMESRSRPLFAYGGLIHNQCERRAHFEFGEFATEWGDAGAQQGWCLYKLGCKGPETYGNCPTARFAEGTSWPVLAGHGCIGCTMPRFWDAMLPAYRRLPSPIPFATNVTADDIGIALVGGVAALTAVHGAGSYARSRLARRRAGGGDVSIETGGEPAEPIAPDETPRGTTATPAEAGGGARAADLAPGQPDEGSGAPSAEGPVEEPAGAPSARTLGGEAEAEAAEGRPESQLDSGNEGGQAPAAVAEPDDEPESRPVATLPDEIAQPAASSESSDSAEEPPAGEPPAGEPDAEDPSTGVPDEPSGGSGDERSPEP